MNLSQNKYWANIFMILTTGVYFASETLQLTPFISENSHYKTTVYTFSYDLLYSWLISYTILKINHIIIDDFPKNSAIIGYAFSYYLGAIGFALLGEVPCLHDLAIVPHFWEHLEDCAKLTIMVFAIGIIILGYYQLKRSIRDHDFITHFVPYFLFILYYGIVLGTLIYGKASEINIHVHHAIGASLLSFWFTDWNIYSSMLFHGILMGVAVEGINFYGIGELSLFLCNNGSIMQLSYMIPICIIWSLFTIISLPYLTHQMKTKSILSE